MSVLQRSDAEDKLVQYLDDCSSFVANKRNTDGTDFSRVTCETCNASRSLFCAECGVILLPINEWPEPLREGSLNLPFDLDIVLDDRRLSATGVQLHTILMSTKQQRIQQHIGFNDNVAADDPCWKSCRLIDIGRNEEIPYYPDAKEIGTYVLFPGPCSQPLSTTINENGISKINRLVVLDCKWSSSSIRLHPSLANLPQVHLDHVPKHSYFWRWHNAGDNMLSTIEAVYYCAWDVATTRPDIRNFDRDNMVHILWLFGLIREIIKSRYKDGRVQSFIHPPAVPFLESSKEFYRLLRKQNHASKKKKDII